MRYVQCPGCGRKFTVNPSENDRSVKCANCGKTLKLAASKSSAGPSVDRGWLLRGFDGEQYGPYTVNELAEFAKEQRIVDKTELLHATGTSNKWVLATSLPELAAIIKPIGVPITAPPINETSPSLTPESAADPRAAIASMFQDRPQREKNGLIQFFVDFLDPTFQRYVTPTIVMVTWWIVLATVSVAFVVTVSTAIISLVPGVEPADANQPRMQEEPKLFFFKPPEFVQDVLSAGVTRAILVAIQFTTSILVLLWVRVILEVFIVLFHISATLRRIEGNLPK